MRYQVTLFAMVRECLVAYKSNISEDKGDAWLAFEKFENISDTPFCLATIDQVDESGKHLKEIARYEV